MSNSFTSRPFLVLFVLFFLVAGGFAQTPERFDILSFKAPKGWQKEVGKDAVQFASEDSKGGVCLITLFKSVPGSEDPKANFEAAWESIVKSVVTVSGRPSMNGTVVENGWTAESGISPYESDGKKGAVLLVTMTGNTKMVNVMILTNSADFQPAIDEFLASIELPKVEGVKPPVSAAPVNPPSNNIVSDKFTTTNFDDGWVGVAKSDWVEVTKGQVRVLLHYPKAGTDIPGDPEPRTVNAWNILVAPRYSNLKGFKTVSPSLDFQRSYLGAGFLTDNATGRPVYKFTSAPPYTTATFVQTVAGSLQAPQPAAVVGGTPR